MPFMHCAVPGQTGGVGRHELGPAQKVSHWHDVEQSTPAMQLELPVHSTRQAPGPQTIGASQVSLAMHWIRQLAACVQSIPPPHEFLPLHSIRQVWSAGQTMGVAQESVGSQAITHTSRSQREQPAGQTNASPLASGGDGASAPSSGPAPSAARTHQPSTQTRPPSHAPPGSQANPSERRSKVHATAPAAKAATTRSASR